MALERFFRLTHQFRWRWWLLGPLLAANLAGIVFGYFFYAEVGQFVPSDLTCSAPHPFAPEKFCQPFWTWPLVADSPNAVLLFFVAALVYRVWGKRNKVLDALAFTLNIFVGLWTTFTFLSYPREMGTFEFLSTNNILFVTHMGMPLQSLTLVQEMRKDAWSRLALAAMLAFLAAFVWVDYWGPHLHPGAYLQGPDQVVGLPDHQWIAIGAPFLMLIAAGAWLLLAKPWPRRAARSP